jgi:uncharacterized protein (TIGR04255 family)
MPFPEYQRVIYQRNPLIEVICQVRFPPILRIDVEPPASFQEAIRGEFPVLSESSGIATQVSIPIEGVPEEFVQQLSSLGMAIAGLKSYSFSSDDGNWTIVLKRDALALTAKNYVEWGEFKTRLRPAIEALISDYRPSHFSRVGLRYRDLICRSELNLSDVAWRDLLEPHIAGELASEAIEPDITRAGRQLLVSLPEQHGQVLLQHGTSPKDGTGETCFVIDADFHTTERTEVTDVWGLLEGLHGQAGRLFRWCIRTRLHDALDPRPAVD